MNDQQKKYHSMACVQMKKLSTGKAQPKDIANLKAIVEHLASFSSNLAAFNNYYQGRANWALQDDLKTARYAIETFRSQQPRDTNPSLGEQCPGSGTPPGATDEDFAAFSIPNSPPNPDERPLLKRLAAGLIRTRIAMTSDSVAADTGINAVVSFAFGVDFQHTIRQIHWINWENRRLWYPPQVTIRIRGTEKQFPVITGAMAAELANLAEQALQAVQKQYGEPKAGVTYLVTAGNLQAVIEEEVTAPAPAPTVVSAPV